MTTPHLTTEEILDMAEPLQQPAAIVRWFKKQGFVVKVVRPNGMPLISRAAWESHLSAEPAASEPKTETPANTPDVAAFLSRFNKGVGYGPHGTQANRQPARARP
jgi:hypothetical protein